MLTALLAKHFRRDDSHMGESPEAANRRGDKRHDVRRYNGVVGSDGLSYQFRLRNLSSTGVSGLTAAPVRIGQIVHIELVKGASQAAIVRWTRGTSVGLSFCHGLPLDILFAILEADQRHCRAAADGDLNLGPLDGVELGIVPGTLDELVDAAEDLEDISPGAPDGFRDPIRELAAEIQDCTDAEPDAFQDPTDSQYAIQERRSEPRIRTLLRIAKITSNNDSGLCCLRSISDSGLMAETDMPLEPGDVVQVDLSDRHQLRGQVVWRDDAGIGVALSQRIDSVSLLSQLAQGGVDDERLRAPRLSISKRAIGYSELGLHNLSVLNISQKGVRVAHSGDLTTGLAVKLRLENGFEERAIVRWSRDGSAGLEFLRMIPYQLLNRVSDF